MEKNLPLLLISILLINNVIAQSVVPAPYYKMVSWNSSQYKSFKVTGGSANPNYNTTFRLLWPKNYDSSMVSTNKYPLILMLHGAGESALGNAKFGTYPNGDPRRYNNDHQLLHQGYEYMSAVNNGKWPGFVLFPQNIYGNWTSSLWILADAVEIVQTLSKTLKIDPDRIYVAGLSDGAHGVWAGLSQYPTMFAAGLPFSGIGAPTSDNTTKVAHLGIWYFQGETDPSPSKGTADRTIQALKNAGGTPVYTVYPNTGHGTWIKAISEPDFFPFMLRYSKLTIHPYFGKTEFSAGETVNVKLGISPGFQGYEWRKNGVLISGATANQIIATSLGSYTVRFKRGTVWTKWSDPLVLKFKTPFAVSIDTPIQGTLYRGGQTIPYSGSGTNSQGGALASSVFSWKLEFHKPGKIVYIWTRNGSKTGSFGIPTSGEISPDVFYRLILTVTNTDGTKKTTYRDMPPYKTSITLATQPSGLKITLDGNTKTSPHSFIAVEGRRRTVGVINPQTYNGKTYTFSNWSQGGSSTQTITVPTNDIVYTAVFMEESEIVIGPTATISTPISGTKYKGGQTISYSGNGKNEEGRTLALSALSWRLEFHKPSKIVYVWTRTGSSSGVFTIPSSGETSASVFYRLILTATDGNGNKTTTYRDIPPLTSTVRLSTQPTGLQIILDSKARNTPYTFLAVEGRRRTIGVVSPQSYEGKSYKFSYWMHGGSASQIFTVPANDITYTAVYVLNTASAKVSDQRLWMKSHEADIVLYPNPATDYIKVNIEADLGEKLILGITNAVGSTLKSIVVNADKQGVNSFDLNVKDLHNSSYTLRVQNKKQAYFKHFIVYK